ncbi:AAA domain-containing protein [Kribbella qitaiheensis]|uniref:AAA domain-containing protein n=1 Tax=Kribbella qitaiheensis TaxID=1544730 RepID=UPI00361DAB19
MSAEIVRALLQQFLMGEDASFGPYSWITPDEPEEIEEILKDRLYRTQLVDRRKYGVEVQIFLGIEDLGGLLWEQDVRALMRISASTHPGLATIVDGGYVPADQTNNMTPAGGMAFVATRAEYGSRPYGERDAVYLHDHPELAFHQFRSLVRALADLHFAGLTHRNICPSGLSVVTPESRRLQFSRYELSAFLTDLFRATVDSAESTAELRALLLPETEWHYVPPERVAFLLGSDADLVENVGSDVFALAALAAEWYLGSLHKQPALSPAKRAEQEDGSHAVEQQRAYARRLQAVLRGDRSIPPDLAEILAKMLSPDPDDRPAADLVVGMLSEAYDRILNTFAGPELGRPHLLVYMPKESTDTIYKWSLIDHRPDTEVGEQELAAFIGDDIRGAYVTDSPLGATPFVSGHNLVGLSSARVLVKGRDVAWFCDYFRPMDQDGNLSSPTDRALVIRFVARLDIAAVRRGLEQLDWSSARRMPDVDLIARNVSGLLMDRKIERAPSWTSRVEATRTQSTVTGPEVEFRDALSWLIEYQETELAARTYPFLRVDDYEGGLVTVRHDLPADQRRIRGSAMFVKYAASAALRPEFGHFFAQLEDEEGESKVDVFADRSGRPGERVTTATVERVEGGDRIVLHRKHGDSPVPAQGWMRASGERGTKVGIERQRTAATSLYGNTYLQGQLRSPFAIRTLAHRWKDVGKDLEGNAPEVVQDMLVSEPFVAIQGPPGTGKTRVAATAIAAYLQHDPAGRVLVSAQSNFALDNLAIQVLKEVGEMDADGRPVTPPAGSAGLASRPLALRATTSGSEAGKRVDSAIQPWRRLNAAMRLARQLYSTVGRRQPMAGKDLRDVLEDWREMLADSGESVIPELADRLARGANLVFATCAASTPDILIGSSEALFDWVIVEEAAKAWPTEIAMPLLLGRRWTLIGDHFQLPAHRRQDLQAFLQDCVADPNEAMATVTAERAASFLRHFDMFGGLFTDRPDPSSNRKPPLHTLRVQFRMREPLGELVSRSFYPVPGPMVRGGLPEGKLSSFYSGARRDGIPALHLQNPPMLSGLSVVWLDTHDTPACHDKPHWSNPGEASVVLRLLEVVDPFPTAGKNGHGPDPLAVLTPYREQLRLLAGSSTAAPHLATVHAFQGREADMVIVSLVRDTVHGHGAARIGSGLGHLAQAQLANVLFSRARRMLVIVGRFDHYAEIMGEGGFWTRVCRAVELYGKRLTVKEVLGDVPNRFADGVDLTSIGPSADDRPTS